MNSTEMSSEAVGSLFALACLLILCSFIGGCAIGCHEGSASVYRQAVKDSAGKWVLDSDTGKPKFDWK